MTDTQDKIETEKRPATDQAKATVQPAKSLAHLEAKRAQNLRDNLLKRKLQARARSEGNPSE